jgi:hypothetical protein
MLRERDGATLERYLYREWKYNSKSLDLPMSLLSDNDDEKAEEPPSLFLPTLAQMNDILKRRYQNACPIRTSHVNACWSRLASAQYHYINGKRQKNCVQWLIVNLPMNTVLLVRDLSENFRTGEARECPAYMHTQHGLDQIFCMCAVCCGIPTAPQNLFSYESTVSKHMQLNFTYPSELDKLQAS